MLSGRSNHDLFESGMESIPSEAVVLPGEARTRPHRMAARPRRDDDLLPVHPLRAPGEFAAADNNYTCPIVAFYPQVLEKNMDRLREPGVRYLDPFLNLDDPGASPRGSSRCSPTGT